MLEVKNHAYFQTKHMSELKDVDKVLNHCVKYMEGDWFVSDGTLLGFIRENDLIPHDTDLDVAVYSSGLQRHIEIPDMTLIRTADWVEDGKSIPIQTAYMKDDVIFDIYYYYPHFIEGKWTTKSDFGTLPLDRYEIIPLKTKYGTYPAPKDYDHYLTSRYNDWKTPSHSKGNHI